MTTGPAHWELLQRARAIDNQLFVATCSPARNPDASYQAWGHSTVVSPWAQARRCDGCNCLFSPGYFVRLFPCATSSWRQQHRRRDAAGHITFVRTLVACLECY